MNRHQGWQTRGGHDVPTLLGIGVVAIAAAVLSFASLQALAERAGYAPGLAALLPLAIDAQAVVATRAWLAGGTPANARRYARLLALTAVALSVVGNAGEHAMTAADTATPWWVVVLIASVPPVALAATAHLGALLSTGSRRPDPIESSPIERLTPDDSVAASGPVPASSPTPREQQESRSTTPTVANPVTPKVAAPPSRSIEQLRAEFAAALESASIEIDPESAESIRKALRCSPKRARQLRDEHATLPHLAVVGEQRKDLA